MKRIPFALFLLLTFGPPELIPHSALSRSSTALAEDGEKKKAPTKAKKKKKKKKEAEVETLETKPESVISSEDVTPSAFNEQLEKPPEIDAVLLLDASGSMERTDPKRLRDQAAKLFLRSLGEEDRVAIFEFDKDARSLSEFSAVSEETISSLDQLVSGVTTKGLRTNLEAPVIAALELLKVSARDGSIKTVVLLSDGQMDPDSDPAVAETLLKKLFESDLPGYRESKIRLYTLALSDEADKDLLLAMAKATDGLSWHAPDVSAIHSKFSDLFLSLKQPQVSSLEAGGLTIDPSVREATFYITRKTPEQEISLVTPRGTSVTQVDFPLGTRWYRGELFDIITIPKPLPGTWNVRGVEDPSGFATLLTDLKLQVKWPSPNLKVGDTAQFFARLTSGEEIVADQNISALLDYRYRVVSAKSGATVMSGTMQDEEGGGVSQPGDGIFVGSVKIDEEGDYKLLLGVSTPTFVRQQIIPFTVSKGMVTLELKEGDAFSGTPSVFEIRLGEGTKKLKDIEVRLLAERTGDAPVNSDHAAHGDEAAAGHGDKHSTDHGDDHGDSDHGAEAEDGHGSEKPTVLSLKAVKSQSDPLLYTVDPAKIPGGVYKVSALVRGREGKKKEEVRGESETIDFTSNAEPAPIEEEKSHEPADRSWIFGLIGLLLSVGWAGAAIFYVLKKLDFGKGLPPKGTRYARPASLTQTLEEIKAKLTDDRRPPTPQDLLVFELVKDGMKIPDAAPPAAEPPQPAEES